MDLRTVFGELAGLKSAVRAETEAARELRAESVAACEVLRVELDRASQREHALRRSADDERRRGARALMDLADRLEAAIASARAPVRLRFYQRPDPRVGALAAGLELTLARTADHLASIGVRRVPSVGRTFDAQLMEAVSTASRADLPDTVVVEEISGGYCDDKGPVRTARVVVNRRGN